MTEFVGEFVCHKLKAGEGVYLIESHPNEPIVRCRDCVKWDYDSTYPKKTCFEFSNPEDGYLVATSPDGYCAWGEREDA